VGGETGAGHAPHFACIGLDDPAGVLAALRRAAETPGAGDRVWRDESGASVAATVEPDGSIPCARPSFASKTIVPIRVRGLARAECAYCSRLVVELLHEGEVMTTLAFELENVGEALDRSPLEGRRRWR
jgi:hypothetical protein